LVESNDVVQRRLQSTLCLIAVANLLPGVCALLLRGHPPLFMSIAPRAIFGAARYDANRCSGPKQCDNAWLPGISVGNERSPKQLARVSGRSRFRSREQRHTSTSIRPVLRCRNRTPGCSEMCGIQQNAGTHLLNCACAKRILHGQ